jgi:hypothetical protein
MASSESQPDRATITRALQRLVYVDKLVTIETAWRYCDLINLPRSVLDEP